MKENIRYVVTSRKRGSSLKVGYHIELYPDGVLFCKEEGGWIEKQYVDKEIAKIEIELDKEYAKTRISQLMQEILRLKQEYEL